MNVIAAFIPVSMICEHINNTLDSDPPMMIKSQDETMIPETTSPSVRLNEENGTINDQESNDNSSRRRKQQRPRQYILDRTKGKSRLIPGSRCVDDEENATGDNDTSMSDDNDYMPPRPPCFLCWVPPVVKRFPRLLEQNWVMMRVGRIGCILYARDKDGKGDNDDHDHEHSAAAYKARRIIFTIGLVSNIIALILTFYASLAMTTTNYSLLQATSFTSGVMEIQNADTGQRYPDAYIHAGLRPVAIESPHSVSFNTSETVSESSTSSSSSSYAYIHAGLRAVAIESPYSVSFNTSETASEESSTSSTSSSSSSIHLEAGRQVVSFDEFCVMSQVNGAQGDFDPQQCDACQKESQKLVTTCIFSLLLIFPSITTDFLRMYPAYDLNCQKFYGSIVACLSMLLSIYTWLVYIDSCYFSFYQGQVQFNGAAVIGPENGALTGTFHWQAGNGLICIFTATLLKGIDVIANFIVPSPSIARNRDEQEMYEALYGDQQGKQLTMADEAALTVSTSSQEDSPQQPGAREDLVESEKV